MQASSVTHSCLRLFAVAVWAGVLCVPSSHSSIVDRDVDKIAQSVSKRIATFVNCDDDDDGVLHFAVADDSRRRKLNAEAIASCGRRRNASVGGGVDDELVECADFEIGRTYVVVVAKMRGVSCLVRGERLPRFGTAGRLVSSHDEVVANIGDNYDERHPIGGRLVKRAGGGVRKRFRARETIKCRGGNRRRNFRVETEFKVGARPGDGAVNVEAMNDGKDKKDLLRFVLMPSLWTVYSWLGGGGAAAAAAIANGFVATSTLTFFGDGGTVTIVQRGRKFDDDNRTLSIESTVKERLSEKFNALIDRVNSLSFKKSSIRNSRIALIKVNRSTLEGFGEGTVVVGGGHSVSYAVVVTIVMAPKSNVQSGAIVDAKILKVSIFKNGNLGVWIEPSVTTPTRKDIAQSCCDAGILNGRLDRPCAYGLSRRCRRSNGDDCCNSCRRGIAFRRAAADDDDKCRPPRDEKRASGKKAFSRCCKLATTEIDEPEPPEPPPSWKKICCALGTIRAKSHQQCLVLVPGQCQTIVRDCCLCCTSGMNDAQSLSSALSCKAQKKKPFDECRAARQLCCEDSLKPKPTDAPATTAPPEDSLKEEKFVTIGIGTIGGRVSKRIFPNSSFDVGALNNQRSLVGFGLLTTMATPKDVNVARLVFSFFVAPLVFIISPEADSATDCFGAFYHHATAFRADVAVTLQNRRGNARRVEAKIDGTMTRTASENRLTTSRIVVDGSMPRVFENANVNLTGYEIEMVKSKSRNSKEDFDVIYTGFELDQVVADGSAYVLSRSMTIAFRSRDFVDVAPLPTTLTLSIGFQHVIVHRDSNQVHLIMQSTLKTKENNHHCSQSRSRSWVEEPTAPTKATTSHPPIQNLPTAPNVPPETLPVRGSIDGVINHVPIAFGRLDGWFNPANGTYDVEIHLGDIVFELEQSAAFLVSPATSVLSWLVADGWRKLATDDAIVKTETNATYSYKTGVRVTVVQTSRRTESGALRVDTTFSGKAPSLIFTSGERVSLVSPSVRVVFASSDAFDMAVGDVELLSSTFDPVRFYQFGAARLSEAAETRRRTGKNFFAFQRLDSRFVVIDVNATAGKIRVRADTSVSSVNSEPLIEDACCSVGREMARLGRTCPARLDSTCSKTMRQCCSCCHRGKTTNGKSCQSKAKSFHCKTSYESCCDSSYQDPDTWPFLPTAESPLKTPLKPTNATPADPCSAITCPPGKRCVLRAASTSPSTHGVSVESPIAACVCYNVCPDEKDFGERCGSDNRTYGSECLLRNIACFMGSKLTVAYAGICNAEGRSRCLCNGYSEECDPVTGTCIGCRHNTAGRHCDKCARGYYGTPRNGKQSSCRPCRCPGPLGSPNNFSPTCHLDETDKQLRCDACQKGYGGRQCNMCKNGYYGQPKRRLGKCRKCDCHGNVDTSLFPTCDRETGWCRRCLHNTGGKFCHRCKDGFFGDAGHFQCLPCLCNSIGSISNVCDYRFGVCRCRAGVEGDFCDRCMDGFWRFGRNKENTCDACNCCAEGSVDNTCDKVNGNCLCKKGFSGKGCCTRE